MLSKVPDGHLPSDTALNLGLKIDQNHHQETWHLKVELQDITGSYNRDIPAFTPNTTYIARSPLRDLALYFHILEDVH